jgi:hypothetical protein
MSAATSSIRVTGLGKSKLTKLRTEAKARGVSAEQYARQLIEEGLSLEHQARTTSFDELLAPVREDFRKSGMSEEELDELVDRARTRYHQRTSGRKR